MYTKNQNISLNSRLTNSILPILTFDICQHVKVGKTKSEHLTFLTFDFWDFMDGAVTHGSVPVRSDSMGVAPWK